MSDKAVLVRESWARRVTSAIQTQEADALNASAAGKPTFAESRFYDIRPARLQSAWTQNSAGVYQATAAFIVSDAGAVDTSFIFPVYNIPGAPAPTGTAGETRFFVIWRGRWEAVPMPEAGATAVVQLASAWALTNGVWTATAREIYADGTTSADASTIFAPQFTSQQTPPGTAGTARFWVMWRNNRWESVQDTIEGDVGDTLCPMVLNQSWSRPTENDIYSAPCYPLNANGAADTSGGTVMVFAPAAIGKPYGENLSWKFWAVYRNDRWETIQPNFPPQEGGVGGGEVDITITRPNTSTVQLAFEIV